MTEAHFIDIYERILAIYDTIAEIGVSIATVGAILSKKEICTLEELEEAKQLVREAGLMNGLKNSIADRRAELEEIKKDLNKNPEEMFADLFGSLTGKEKENDCY